MCVRALSLAVCFRTIARSSVCGRSETQLARKAWDRGNALDRLVELLNERIAETLPLAVVPVTPRCNVGQRRRENANRARQGSRRSSFAFTPSSQIGPETPPAR